MDEWRTGRSIGVVIVVVVKLRFMVVREPPVRVAVANCLLAMSPYLSPHTRSFALLPATFATSRHYFQLPAEHHHLEIPSPSFTTHHHAPTDHRPPTTSNLHRSTMALAAPTTASLRRLSYLEEHHYQASIIIFDRCLYWINSSRRQSSKKWAKLGLSPNRYRIDVTVRQASRAPTTISDQITGQDGTQMPQKARLCHPSIDVSTKS